MKRAWAIGALLVLSALSMSQQSPFAVNYDTYKSGQFSSVKTFKTYTIRSQSEWKSYWAETTGNPPETAPDDINWVNSEILAIHLGQRPSSGYSVYVRSIDPITAHEYRVAVVEQVPSRSARTAQMVTSPYVIVRLPRRFATYDISREKVIGDDLSPSRPPHHYPRCYCTHCRAGDNCCCVNNDGD